jgi:phosphoribosyl-ATP pyrophosphohydrolase/phosphoribosyl-AMP cyclohydrolase
MIVPSIDISGGQAIQLVGGEEVVIEAGDPRKVMERFSLLGEIAVIDIDAARGEGSNTEIIADLCSMGAVRVGGGIRDASTALDWLDLGASKVILGTAATPEVLNEIPRDRVMVALDSRDNRLLTHGWRRQGDGDPASAMEALRDYCSAFLITFVEREGRMAGTDLDRAGRLVDAAKGAKVTIAGGITSVQEIAALDAIGADAQVGMALYTGAMAPGDAFAAVLQSDRADGLWPTVVVDEAGKALGLSYSSRASLNEAIDTRAGVYQSRRRGLWRKGQTSGATQELLDVSVDCDRDTLRFTVRQTDGFCHTGARSCWGEDHGMERLARRLGDISESPDEGNTSLLLNDPELLGDKLREEAGELALAASHEDVVAEAADVLYFTFVKAVASGVRLDEVVAELDRREMRVRRRPMSAKEQK